MMGYMENQIDNQIEGGLMLKKEYEKQIESLESRLSEAKSEIAEHDKLVWITREELGRYTEAEVELEELKNKYEILKSFADHGSGCACYGYSLYECSKMPKEMCDCGLQELLQTLKEK